MSSEDKRNESLQADSESRAELVDLFYQGKNVESLALDLCRQYTIPFADLSEVFMVYDFPDLTDLSEIAEEEVTDSTSEERIDELTEQYFDNAYENSMAGTKVLVVCVSGKDREVWLAVYLDMHGNPGSVGAYKDRETLISALEAEGRVVE